MNVWVRLPRPWDTAELLAAARKRGVAFLPGRYFEVSRRDPGALRLSFAGLEVDSIRKGLEIIGQVMAEAREKTAQNREPIPAMV
jgi:2-aminoadipate transaminase